MAAATDFARLPSLPEPLHGLLDELVFTGPTSVAQGEAIVGSGPAATGVARTPAGAAQDLPSLSRSALQPNTLIPSASQLSIPELPVLKQAPGPRPVYKKEAKYEELSSSNQENTDFAESASWGAAAGERIRRSGRQRKRPVNVSSDSDEEWAPVKEKRPVGRPIAYSGDPDSPLLSESERRQIKRRIANRDSARRVRQRKQQDNNELQAHLRQSLERERALMEHINACEQNAVVMKQQMQALNARLQAALSAGERMQVQLAVAKGAQREAGRMPSLPSESQGSDCAGASADNPAKWDPPHAGCG